MIIRSKSTLRATSPLLAILAIPLWGCGEILDIPGNPQLTPQEQATGPWRCLGQFDEFPSAEVTTATVEVQVCNFMSSNCSEAVTGLSVRVCNKVDPTCTNPIEDGLTDEDGTISFDIDTNVAGFSGYIEVMPPMMPCIEGFCADGCTVGSLEPQCQIPSFAPALQFFNPPVVADYEQPMILPLFPTEALPSVIEAAGATSDPTKGNLFIVAFNCDGERAAGVTYTITENPGGISQLYMKDGAVTNTVLETDASGVGGFINVPAGFAEVEAFNEDQDLVGSVGLVARGGFMTYSPLVPSPSD